MIITIGNGAYDGPTNILHRPLYVQQNEVTRQVPGTKKCTKSKKHSYGCSILVSPTSMRVICDVFHMLALHRDAPLLEAKMQALDLKSTC